MTGTVYYQDDVFPDRADRSVPGRSSVGITTSTDTALSPTITSASPVAYATSYAITCWNMQSATGSPTWTPASWTSASSTAATSTVDHAFTDIYAGPPLARRPRRRR